MLGKKNRIWFLAVLLFLAGLVFAFFVFKKYNKNVVVNPKISVIIPVYNAEPYLEECIDSIVNQTYKNLEIICINDGSKDDSIKILNRYKEKYNIIVIDQPNGGVSSARNAGLNRASGDYITFADADDWLELDAYEKCMKIIKKTNPDILSFGIVGNETGTKVNYTYVNDPFNAYDNIYASSVWSKIFKRDIIFGENLTFKHDVRFGEDALFMIMAYVRAETIEVTSYKPYHYRTGVETSIENTVKFEARSQSAIKRAEYMINDMRIKEHPKVGTWLLKNILDISIYAIEGLENPSDRARYSKELLQILESKLLRTLDANDISGKLNQRVENLRSLAANI